MRHVYNPRRTLISPAYSDQHPDRVVVISGHSWDGKSWWVFRGNKLVTRRATHADAIRAAQAYAIENGTAKR